MFLSNKVWIFDRAAWNKFFPCKSRKYSYINHALGILSIGFKNVTGMLGDVRRGRQGGREEGFQEGRFPGRKEYIFLSTFSTYSLTLTISIQKRIKIQAFFFSYIIVLPIYLPQADEASLLSGAGKNHFLSD